MSEEENKSEDTSENQIKTEGKGDTDARVYELGYLLAPTVAEENLPAVYGDLKDAIVATFKGAVVSDEMPKMITLAYPMKKVVSNVRSTFTTAYFGWIKFTMDAPEVLELKKRLDLDPNMIRFLLIKTVRENTIATKRFVRGDTSNHRIAPLSKPREDEPAVPINKEEVDKEIDALVATQ